MTTCPRCRHVWPDGCEHAISVELFGVCIWCRRQQVTAGESAQVKAEHARRKTAFEWIAPRNPRE